MKAATARFLDEHRSEFAAVSKAIWENPELGHREFYASSLLTDLLAKFGFAVNQGTAGMETAFTAVYDSGKEGPVLGYLSEYDALPGLGHACGHNLIGVASAAAAIALREAIDAYGGKAVVFGTPAEETNGAKVTMAEQGLFDQVDAVMMVHPLSHYERSGSSMAMEALQFDYFGKAAHAAANPEDGINALDAVIQLFNGVNALRQQLPDGVRVHGIISNGGEAPNIIPDFAQAKFYVRAANKRTLQDMVDKVKRCADAAALSAGCRIQVSNYELSYDDMRTNSVLSQQFTDNLIQLGVKPDDVKEGQPGGSIDLGNVSYRTAAIHPYIQIADCPFALHTPEFRAAAGSERGMDAMILGAKALAWTGCDLLEDRTLLQRVRDEFQHFSSPRHI
ncbi:M20 family metallopeptidase [Xylanibacillus composti]|uniref:M20 family metallopeptidase n=1 Tax=Xylanibacillus composti TaxID=1572762 RepID=UPI0035709BA3